MKLQICLHKDSVFARRTQSDLQISLSRKQARVMVAVAIGAVAEQEGGAVVDPSRAHRMYPSCQKYEYSNRTVLNHLSGIFAIRKPNRRSDNNRGETEATQVVPFRLSDNMRQGT
eukprot:4258165-Amphidinium_carterae.3